MAKFYNIDPETCSKEELLQAIAICQDAENMYHDQEQACKIFLNSCYGALANQFYSCSNIDIAESITLQGQDLIKYSANAIDEYFRNIWHTDYNGHNLVADALKEKFPDFDKNSFLEAAKKQVEFNKTLEIAGDTDSAYITLQPVINSCNISHDLELNFVVELSKKVIEPYIENMLQKYADMYNCKENLEKFELEKISRSAILIAKKKYILSIGWLDPDIYLPPLHKIVIAGLEMVQGSTPEYCRNEMKDFTKFIISKIESHEQIKYDEIVQKIRQMKQRFAMQNPNVISKSFTMSDYEKFVYDDKSIPIVYTDAVCPIHVRGAAVYNNMLYNNAKKYRSKYSLLKKGDRVKFYYINSNDVFSFIPNEFPVEFAPKMDIDTQFEKMLLDPLNRIIEAIGFPKLGTTLTWAPGLW